MISDSIFATEIRLYKAKKTLSVKFNDGFQTQLSAELLLVESPSAEVQGYSVDQKKIIHEKQNVKIIDIEYIGNYAVRLLFDDGHETGIYSWALLYDYGVRQKALYAEYERKINSEVQKMSSIEQLVI